MRLSWGVSLQFTLSIPHLVGFTGYVVNLETFMLIDEKGLPSLVSFSLMWFKCKFFSFVIRMWPYSLVRFFTDELLFLLLHFVLVSVSLDWRHCVEGVHISLHKKQSVISFSIEFTWNLGNLSLKLNYLWFTSVEIHEKKE